MLRPGLREITRATSCALWGLVRALQGAALAGLLWSEAAADPTEFWPELNLYERLGPTTRLYFSAAFSTGGKESRYRTLDAAGYFDLTLKPVLLPSLEKEDWRRKRYLWVRVGYDHVFKVEEKTLSTPEDRGILALHGRAYLPAALLFEARARADLRWIGGDYSTRYRVRGEVNRDFTVRDHAVTPYLQAEYCYDTRYDGWSRQLYQVGAELEVTPGFRIEPSVARQLDRLPSASGLWAIALVARWYD